MLKWTVKKRFVDDRQQQLDDEDIRRVHGRKSLGNFLGDSKQSNGKNISKYNRRRSLGSHMTSERVNIDKENHSVTPVRRKSTRQSSTPLSDCSNLREMNCAAKRKHHLISSTKAPASPSISPISLSFKEIFIEPAAAIFPLIYAPTLPTFDVEYSPVLKSAQRSLMQDYDEIPAKRVKMDLSYEFKPESASTSSPLSTPLVTRRKFGSVPLELSNSIASSETSLNSSEVGDTTLQRMIDDILASARNGKKFKKCLPRAVAKSNRDKNSNLLETLSEDMEQKSIEKLLSIEKIAQVADQTIIIADNQNEREVKSPDGKCDVEVGDCIADDETCQLRRQNAVRRKNASNENKNKIKSEESQKTEKELHDSSIQKCLSFSSANFDDMSDKFKRSSVASNSSSSSNSYVSQSKYTKNLLMKGTLEMAITTEENRKKIIIHGEFGKVFNSSK